MELLESGLQCCVSERVFSAAALDLDERAETARIGESIRNVVMLRERRRGAVVGLSGGIDSSVVAALCARALGADKVLGLLMPEQSASGSGDSLLLGRLVADTLGIACITEDISEALAAAGCYRRQEEAIRSVVPEYGAGWKCKLSLPSILDGARMNITRLTVQSPPPESETKTVRLTAQASQQIVAATHYKQRIRKMTEYYHADRLQYAVAGTPNRLEYDQGFFVKQGDGAADFKPIAHLYKTQVYQLARHLGIPEEIRRRPPATATVPMEQIQEEFYFALPYDRMDLCLFAHNHAVPAAEAAPVLGLTPAQVECIYRDITATRRATQYLHMTPQLVVPVKEIEARA